MYKARMGAPLQQKMSTHRFLQEDCAAIRCKIRQRNKYHRSFSNNEQRTLMVSRSTQSGGTDSSHISKTTDKAAKNKTCSELYANFCENFEDFKNGIQHLTSQIGITSPSHISAFLDQANEFISLRTHTEGIKIEIEKLEKEIESTKMCNYTSVQLTHNLNDSITHTDGNRDTNTLNDSNAQTNTKIDQTTMKESVVILDDLKTLHVFPQSTSQILPFSLESHLESLSSGACADSNESMSNELLRLSSLSTFPREIDISMTRLASAGFYHLGNSGDTKCFSCGITYSQWKSADDPIAVHKKLSPTCNLVNNVRTNHSSVVENSNRVESKPKHSTSVPSIGMSIQQQEANNHKSTTTTATQSQTTTTSGLNGATSTESEFKRETSENRDATRTSKSNQSPVHESQTNSSENRHIVGNIEDAEAMAVSKSQHNNDLSALGINIEKPRYPNYAPLQVRISSYEGWPSYLEQTPRDMAVAGFLFAGYHDYTRCFFCGGGLRNWEPGDDPWVEHARWFPKCPFVKQNKGEKFIQEILKRQKEKEQGNITNNDAFPQQLPSTNNQALDVTSHINNSLQDPLQSVAARSVLEMGYTNDQVTGALKTINELRPGTCKISAIDIMRILLNDADGNSTETVTSVVATNGTISGDVEVSHDSTAMTKEDNDSLIEENRQLREERLCKICFDMEATIAFLPCGHIACCSDCAPAMRKCPLCRTYVRGTVKTYLA